MMLATFSLAGLTVMCSDSTVTHAFSFTPSRSLFLTCTTEVEVAGIAAMALLPRFIVPSQP